MFDGPVENANLRVISLGAGVQSSVMALMATHGEIEPMPDAAIFADTQWEPEAVYEHLDWLETQLPFPVYKVTDGNIRELSLGTLNEEWAPAIPIFIATEEGGMGMRQCTFNYKIKPIERQIRTLLGLKKGQRVPKNTVVESWIGISKDELIRAKESRTKWITNRHPLIEKRMSRYECGLWFKERYPERTLTRSACIGCPYRSNESWRNLRDTDEESWLDAIDFDHALRGGPRNGFGMKAPVYLHSSMVPLDQVDLSTEQDKGQTDMFGEECEGMCGV